MRIEGVGELIEAGAVWHLVYAACGHVQVLAREGLEDPERARRDVLRYYTECLICRATGRRPPEDLILPPPEV